MIISWYDTGRNNMKIRVRDIWISSIEIMSKKPVVLAPFAIIAFLELLALELLYFAPQKPLMYLANPIIRKFFGPSYTHYPNNLLILPKFFYVAQLAIYIIFGVFLSAITVSLVKNIRRKLPLTMKAVLRNNYARYASYLMYGIFIALVVYFSRKGSIYLFSKFFAFVSSHIPMTISKYLPILLPPALYIANIIINVFFILVIPIIVIKRSMLIKAIGESIYYGFRYFLKLFVLMFVPYLLYFPIALLKNFPGTIATRVHPEALLWISVLGIVMVMFIECFIVVCVSQFILNIYEKENKK